MTNEIEKLNVIIAAKQAKIERLEARLAILETPDCFSCGAKVTEQCRRPPDKACGRAFHGGSRRAIRDVPA
jgi:hypothetical protein